MERKKITQHEAIFYQLYRNRKKDREQYIPIWQLIGEVFCEELGVWGFVSYEVSARMSELFKENPALFERKQVQGKTGANYFAYRISITAKGDDIKGAEIRQFYIDIRGSGLTEYTTPVRKAEPQGANPFKEPIITKAKSEKYPYTEYTITDFGTSIECTCPSYQYRRECKHVKKRLEEINLAKQTPMF